MHLLPVRHRSGPAPSYRLPSKPRWPQSRPARRRRCVKSLVGRVSVSLQESRTQLNRRTSRIFRMLIWGRGTGASLNGLGRQSKSKRRCLSPHASTTKPPTHGVYGNPGTGVRKRSEQVYENLRSAHSGDAIDAVFDTQPWENAAFPDEERLVQPCVALVSGLEARRRPEILIPKPSKSSP